jgi:threonine dehydrogenase-like Zn-dependent dehydrogenase
MKRIYAHLGEPVVRDVDEPTVRPGEILVDTAFSTVSAGTETLVLRRSLEYPGVDMEYPGSNPRWPKIRDGAPGSRFPRPAEREFSSLGYSAAGIVREVGEGVLDVVPGMAVACSGSQCAHHAQVIAVPRNLVTPLPEGVSLQQGAFVTLGSIAVEALRKADVRFGETVIIYGLGLLGLLAAQIARAGGLYVIGLDVNPDRLTAARRLGFVEVYDPQDNSTDEHVRNATGGFGADAVLLGVVSESSRPLNHAMELCRQRGKVVGLGVFGMTIDRTSQGQNDVVITQSIAYGPGRYDPRYEEEGVDYPIGLVRWTENRNMTHFLRLLAESKVDLSELAPEPFPIDEAPAGYRLLRSPSRPPTIQFRHQR